MVLRRARTADVFGVSGDIVAALAAGCREAASFNILTRRFQTADFRRAVRGLERGTPGLIPMLSIAFTSSCDKNV